MKQTRLHKCTTNALPQEPPEGCLLQLYHRYRVGLLSQISSDLHACVVGREWQGRHSTHALGLAMVAICYPPPLQLLTQKASSHNNSIATPGQPQHAVGILRRADGEHILYIFPFAGQGLRAKIGWEQ